MFLDDELELIHNDGSVEGKDKSVALIRACLKRLPTVTEVSPTDYLNEIKKTENGWKLFCQRHPMYYNADGFRKCVQKLYNDALPQSILNYLRWND